MVTFIYEKKNEGFRVMHGINQLNSSLFFQSMLIPFSHWHYPLQIVKRTTTKKSDEFAYSSTHLD